MKKRAITCLLLISICAGIMAGCGVNTPGTDTAPDRDTEEKTIVSFQTWNPADLGEDSPIHQIITAFEQENPDIRIDYRYVGSSDHLSKLKVELMSGQGPDAFGMNSGASYLQFRDYEEDLTDYCISAMGADWEQEFVPACRDLLEDGGRYYGLPLGFTYSGYIWTDTAMLSSYGLDLPESYDDLKRTCSILRSKGQMPLAIGARDGWVNLDLWMSMAADFNTEALYDAIEGRGSFVQEDIIASLCLFQECFENGVFQDDALRMHLYNDVNDLFQREAQIPMIVNGTWGMNMYTLPDQDTHANFCGDGTEHDLVLIDWNDDGRPGPVTGCVDVTLCINRDSEHKEEAFRWINYLVHQGQDVLVNNYLEYMPSRTNTAPSLPTLPEDGQRNLSRILSDASSNMAGPRGIRYAELEEKVCEMLAALGAGEITPEDAAVQIQEVSNQLER